MKKRTRNRMLSFVMAMLLCIPNMGSVAYGAQNNGGLSNEESQRTEQPVISGYQELDAWDVSFTDEDFEKNSPVKGTLPKSFSSSIYAPVDAEVERNWVTPIRNQNPYGTCWAHAAMCIAETSYIKNYGLNPENVDFNEYQHVYYAFHQPYDELNLFGGDYNENVSGNSELMVGGNVQISLNVLASWIGASGANEDVFNAGHIENGQTPAAAFAYDDEAHMRNGYVLYMPDMATANYQADMEVVKSAIMNYGGVAISYYALSGGSYYEDGYQCINEERGTNHSVTVVGWDDNIPASAFPNGAPGNGAWLVKNSWGDWYGLDGYFWLSYYDKSIDENAYAFDFVSADNYDNNYQYDGTGSTYFRGGNGSICGANAFVADSNEILEAVGVTTKNVNVNYEVRVYTGLAAGASPTSGNLAHTQTGMLTYAGFNTIGLDTPIFVNAGERYAVVITLTKSGENVYMAIDNSANYGWVSFTSYAKAGESYMGSSISRLSDCNPSNSTYAKGTNVRIKAYTNEIANDGYAHVPYGVKQASDGNWYYYKNGAIQYSYNGLARNGSGIWFIRNGKVDFSVNNVAQCGNDWYYFLNGAVQRVNTVAPTADGNWWCITDGRLDFTYTGLAQNEYGWWYIEGGWLNFGYTGLVQYNGIWFYVENGQLNWNYTGLAMYNGIWFYVENGQLNWNYTGLVMYNGVWFYVEGGQLNWNYTGLVMYNGIWFYVEGGQLNWNYAGLVQYNGVWFYVEGGQLNWGYTGLVMYNDVWFFVENGVLNWEYTGLSCYNNIWFYVEGGMLNWGYTGAIYFDGAWWDVVNGIAVRR